MPTSKPLSFLDFLKETPDHRIDRKKLHPVEEILLLAFTAIIAGCDSWEDIELFGKTKIDSLRTYYPYKNGTASDDTIRRFFRSLDPNHFETKFIDWVKSFQLGLEKKVISIDGKTSRRSFDTESSAMHMVSAFACEYGVTIGQVKTEEKSNEITAIPELLEMLDITGSVITIDAMGTQHKIAKLIVDKNADYLLALKGNQGSLNDDVRLYFERLNDTKNIDTSETVDKGHGRIETRSCKVSCDIEWLRINHPQWANLNAIVEITSNREIGDEKSTEKRYYISSLTDPACAILDYTRQHWGIESVPQAHKKEVYYAIN